MKIWIEVFTILGSVLGAIAFIQNLLKPMLEYNKHRWEYIKENYISDTDFKNMQFTVGNSNLIERKDLCKLTALVYAIRDDLEGVRFKSFIKNDYKIMMNDIVSKYDELRSYVQVPTWEPGPRETALWHVNKQYFYENAERTSKPEDFRKADEEYRNHLNKVYDLLGDIYEQYNDIGMLANRTMIEWISSFRKRA